MAKGIVGHVIFIWRQVASFNNPTKLPAAVSIMSHTSLLPEGASQVPVKIVPLVETWPLAFKITHVFGSQPHRN